MSREVKFFYELQQYGGGGRWATVGFFRTEAAANAHSLEFNTGTTVATMKIIRREFKG